MQTTAIGTVANSLPENEVILLTLLISKGYILFAELLNKKHGTTFEILSNVNPCLFHDVIQNVRQYLYSGDTVDIHDDYSVTKCYLSSDGLSGFVVEPVGNLISWSQPQVHNRIALRIVSPPMFLWIIAIWRYFGWAFGILF